MTSIKDKFENGNLHDRILDIFITDIVLNHTSQSVIVSMGGSDLAEAIHRLRLKGIDLRFLAKEFYFLIKWTALTVDKLIIYFVREITSCTANEVGEYCRLSWPKATINQNYKTIKEMIGDYLGTRGAGKRSLL
ncbi:MAG: hypothetical protein IH840_00010 [Candidatus Heimdallarchaeota archaeon]|nr:hypothetical protein [Candidatus Heimdallarchaeota archaeon]